MLGITLFMGAWLFAGQADVSRHAVVVPATDGPEGQRVFDDLAQAYARKKAIDSDGPLKDLSSSDTNQRASAAKYLLALLRQTLADETNGRYDGEKLSHNYRSSQIATHRFRNGLAEKLAESTAIEALDAAVWLVESDPHAANKGLGAKLLCQFPSSQSEVILRRLLNQPGQCEPVLVTIIDEIGKRKLESFKPDIVPLVTHYRLRVREAARRTATLLGATSLPEYKRADAITPWLDARLKDVLAMVQTKLPQNPTWVRLEEIGNPDSYKDYSRCHSEGWLIDKNEQKFRVLNVYGQEYDYETSATRWIPADFAEMAVFLVEECTTARTTLQDTHPEVRFESAHAKVDGVLVAAWAYALSNKDLTTEVLFPCLELIADDRLAFEGVRDHLGDVYHQRMLVEFSHQRDYDRTIALARHLSQPLFDGYRYQRRAKELADQLPRRRGDFRELRLPAEEEWSKLQAKLSRDEQVTYLARRLRLLNCFQWGQPGGVDFRDPQYAESRKFNEQGTPVVNPYVELRSMHLQISELPTLIPFLADENFLPTFSFWRDFHSDRTLYRVNGIVAALINEVAAGELAELKRDIELNLGYIARRNLLLNDIQH